MGTPRHPISTRAAIRTICSLLVPLVVLVAVSGSAAPPPEPAGRWPRSFVAPNGATVTINQPQIADWPNESSVTLYAAVSYLPKNAARPTAGTVVVEADTAVGLRDRLVHFSRIAVVDTNFPQLPAADVAEIVAVIEKSVPPEGRTVALDDLLAAMTSRPVVPRNAAGLKADPPIVFVSKRPAVVVNIDGSPVWRTVAGNPLQTAVNTNWELFKDAKTTTYYIRDGRVWLAAPTLLGPWMRSAAPASYDPAAGGQRGAAKPAPAASGATGKTPAVFVSRQPAELIVLDGEPIYRRVPGTASLNWVSNTDSDLFRDGTAGTIYYLIAGRWFAAPDLTGPWSFATQRLPADFSRIPIDHPRSHVLASVPGTPQAAEAVRLAQAARTARVNKKGLTAPAVRYDGTPTFQLIGDSTVARAVNTDSDVLKVGIRYYLCADGVWFASAAPTGPWKVTGAVPVSIYQIPPTSPAYRVTAVSVVEDYEDWTVIETKPGYGGAMVAGGTVVWGTGFVYPPYIGGTPSDPIYFQRPVTYGAGAWYNPWTASFGRARVGYGPSASADLSARVYERWDPRLVRPADRLHDAPRTAGGAVGTTGTAGPSVAVGTTGVATPPSALSGAESLYAGRDGSVYRHRAAGWEKLQNGNWVAVRRASANDAPILRQLDDDAKARAEASVRRRAAVSVRDDWGVRAASYRPAGRPVP